MKISLRPWPLFLSLLLAGCQKEPDVVTTYELLSAHTWVSDRYVFEGEETANFHWDCLFFDANPEFGYEGGDYGRLEIDMELTFRADSLYRRILFVSRYVKCGSCNTYEFVEQTSDTLGAFYTAETDRIWFGSRNDRLQYYYPVEYLARNKIIIKEFFEVFAVLRDSDCYFNDRPLTDDRNYPVDFVFRPKK